MRKLTIILIAFVLCGTAWRGEALYAKTSVEKSDSARTGKLMTATALYIDPAVGILNKETDSYSVTSRLFSPYKSLSRAAVLYKYSEESEARVPQEGDGLRMGAFNAESFLRLSDKSVVTGEVSYKRGVRRHVNWNESSDYELLRPYVLADTVGGNIQSEQYAFGGGWAAAFGRTSLGIEGNYRALHEYRSVDPRPRNITSDFNVKASVGRIFGRTYIAAAGAYRKYNQSQGVTFLSENGANTTIFHMTGLGTHYGRFAGNNTFSSTGFRGNGFEGLLLARPSDGDKWSSGVSWSGIRISSRLMNQNEAPITSLFTQNLKWFGTYKVSVGTCLLAIKGKAGYELRQGDENVIDNNADGVYLSLLSITQYREKVYTADLHGVLEWRAGYGQWHVSPGAVLKDFNSKKEYPERNMDYSFISPDMTVGFTRLGDNWLWKVEGGIAYDININKELSLPLRYTEIAFRTAFTGMYERLSDSRFSGCVKGFVQRRITKSTAVFVSGEVKAWRFEDDENRITAELSVGLSF